MTGESFTYRVGDLTTVVHRLDGPGDAVFVLVHGIAVSSRYFQPTAAELARHGTVYLVDLPGYGAAPKAGRDVSIADHAAAVAGFVRQAGLDNPVIVGHSMGCQVVSQLAVDAPELSDRMVLMAPTMPLGERSLFQGGWRLLLDSVRNPLTADAVILADYFVRCGVPYFLAQTKHLFGDRIEDRLAGIAAKTLVIVGDKDRVVPLAWSRAVTAGIPNARLEVVRGPHVIMYSDPVRIAELISGHAE